jgi:hypothetical protein
MCQAPRAPNGATARAPAVIATARPPRPGTAALAQAPVTMYMAQNAAEARANVTPAMLDVHRLRLLRELDRRGTLAAVARALSYSRQRSLSS